MTNLNSSIHDEEIKTISENTPSVDAQLKEKDADYLINLQKNTDKLVADLKKLDFKNFESILDRLNDMRYGLCNGKIKKDFAEIYTTFVDNGFYIHDDKAENPNMLGYEKEARELITFMLSSFPIATDIQNAYFFRFDKGLYDWKRLYGMDIMSLKEKLN